MKMTVEIILLLFMALIVWAMIITGYAAGPD